MANGHTSSLGHLQARAWLSHLPADSLREIKGPDCEMHVSTCNSDLRKGVCAHSKINTNVSSPHWEKKMLPLEKKNTKTKQTCTVILKAQLF